MERGLNYLLYEQKGDLSYKILKKMLEEDENARGICLTTTYPKKLFKIYKLKDVKVLWLSDSKTDGSAVSPSRMEFEITRELTRFIKEHGENAIVLIDGFEYLMLANEFDKVRKFIKKLCDLCSMKEATLLVTVNPESFSKETTTTLSRDFDMVDEAKKFWEEMGGGVFQHSGAQQSQSQPAAAPSQHVSHRPPSGYPPSFSPPPAPRPVPSPPPQPASASQDIPASYSSYTPPPAPRPVVPESRAAPGIAAGEVADISIEDMYLIHRATGILIQRKTWREEDLVDPDLIGGMLRAILDFVNQSFSSGETAKFSHIEIKGYTILIYDGKEVSLATVISGDSSVALAQHRDEIRAVIEEIVDKIEAQYRDKLENFDGHVQEMKGIRKYLDELSVKMTDIIMGTSPLSSLPSEIPDSAVEHYNKGVVLARQGRYEEAIKEYDQALKIEPRYTKAMFNKAVVLQMMRRNPEAVEVYRRLAALTPDDPEVWSNMAIALRAMGRLSEALECYDRALAINPNDPGLWSNKGVALRLMGRAEEALECYDRALAINPNDPGLWSNKGVALASLNRLEEALECYDRALAIDPNRASARRNREIILRQLEAQRGRR